MWKKVKKQYFTLIEIIVVLLVITLVAGIFAINIRGLWRQQVFLDEANLILNQLRLAQDMMQIMDTDNEVIFERKDNTFVSVIQPKSTPPTLADTIAKGSKITLSQLGILIFEDINGKILEPDFNLTFYSRGFAMNHGVLKLGPKGAKEPNLAIALFGYPRPLTLQSVDSYSPPSTAEQNFIIRLTEMTKEETRIDEEKKGEEEDQEEKVEETKENTSEEENNAKKSS